MSEISSLSLKISPELKEKIKAAALENEVSISAEVSARLLRSFDESHLTSDLSSESVDSQGTEEVGTEAPLTQKELKKLRELLKGKSKVTSKKK
ncbi:hypothetical protein F6Q07_08940 [Pectobacterium parmentieri]|uniref:Uncharacterized protein n=1 Tax=Pectobacterium parmentieri TaxID=1905730 RepID=A0A8B3FYN5_PECPM|nr:hypothetical protein [Pectobacterium parmentieri]ACX88585.1 conserved hypothetical protein [Pectobacterium parmentieri WPP163]AOR58161.1 hypothetical protein A8F97_04485 [Pectobacterium parmentieri]AYH02007.1 hypothetical protein C5E26_14240 [Pectobacterium parmentieri]AYH06269.1 hypothetical protein C5E25_13385 [Pectobacterium parmentieri]AYH10826.1 hypothetical protein C5E24_14595 [Pectobacterium parmentieri]